MEFEEIQFFFCYKICTFSAEDDEGYRSASPSSQNIQSQACVILWAENTDFFHPFYMYY